MICGPRIRTSPSSASFSSMPGVTCPTVPSLISSGQVDGAAAACSPTGPTAPPPARRSRGRTRAPRAASAPRRRRRPRARRARAAPRSFESTMLVGLRVLRGELRRDLLARPAPARTFWCPTSIAHFSARLRSRVLLGLDHRLEAGLQLLPDARDGEEPGRPHLGQVGDHLARVRAARDRVAEHDRQVVAGRALGDVRHRQVGHDARALGEVDHVVERLARRSSCCGA